MKQENNECKVPVHKSTIILLILRDSHHRFPMKFMRFMDKRDSGMVFMTLSAIQQTISRITKPIRLLSGSPQRFIAIMSGKKTLLSE